MRLLLATALLVPALASPALAGQSRVELHVHLDGSVDSTLLLELCQLRNLSLPGVGVPTSTAEGAAPPISA